MEVALVDRSLFCMITVLGLVREAKFFKLGNIHGVDDLIICRRLRVLSVHRPPKTAKVVCWKPPDPGCYKLNVDRSSNLGRIYAGCVVRNSRRFFVAAFSISLGRGFAFDAEILAGMYAVVFARSMGWTHLWLELDSRFAVKVLLSNGKNLPWRVKLFWTRFEEAQLPGFFSTCYTHI